MAQGKQEIKVLNPHARPDHLNISHDDHAVVFPAK